MEIIPHKKYKTRDGRDVRVFSVLTSNNGRETVFGMMKDEDGDWDMASWFSDGSFLADRTEDVHDIIEEIEDDWKMNRPMMCRDNINDDWRKRHYYKHIDGKESGEYRYTQYVYWREPTKEEL
jgi:hypothetical protein